MINTSVTIPDDILACLDKEAQTQQRSRSGLINWILRERYQDILRRGKGA